ncbi:MAG: hypothetical protein L0191_01890, partial [Acidobacteria bacterium]|nr:hypothetical protein [Acidobacteriota bacterium]
NATSAQQRIELETQVTDYDRERGISYWTKNYRTRIEEDVPDALSRMYEYYDPIYLLPASGQAWWRAHSPPSAKTA